MNSNNSNSLSRQQRMNGAHANDDWSGLASSSSASAHGATATPFKKMHRLLRGRYPLAITLALIGAVGGAIAGYKSTSPKYRAIGYIEVQPVIKNPLKDDKMMLMYQAYIQNQVALLDGP